MKSKYLLLGSLLVFSIYAQAKPDEADAPAGADNGSNYFTVNVDYASGEPVDVKTDDGKGISVGFMSAAKRSWGFRGFATYEFKRDVEYAGGFFGIFAVPTGGDKVQFHVLQADALFRTGGAFYIPFGLSYVIPVYESADPARKVSFSGGLGTQGGVGWLINDLFNIEILTRLTIMEAKVVDNSGGSAYSSSGGSMFGAVFRFGFAF